MLDQKAFGEKLRNHRKSLSLSQEEVADQVGVSPQAVSKWETGECLPDCFNLASICKIYGISADLLLETETVKDIDQVAAKIEQLADEYIWTQSGLGRYDSTSWDGQKTSHRDLGADLLKLWKGIYFIETGNREVQKREKEMGNLRIKSDFGLKIWDDDGIVAVVSNQLLDRLDSIGEKEYSLMQTLCTRESMSLLSAFPRDGVAIGKADLIEKCGIEPARLNDLLLTLLEAQIIEFVSKGRQYPVSGYKISGHFGITAYLVLASLFILSKTSYTVSEYLPDAKQ